MLLKREKMRRYGDGKDIGVKGQGHGDLGEEWIQENRGNHR